jgi:GNAT superfamily N-acetyltransferase
MIYEVKPVTPEMASIFTSFFENLDFSHARHWSTCFCRYYHTDCSPEEWFNRPAGQNRKEAFEAIANGTMKGYLAFDHDTCIGWCNANNLDAYPRLKAEAKLLGQGKKVGCVICFVVHPDYRNQGVARMLLKRAIEGFQEEGYDAVVGCPFGESDMAEKRYHGTFNMFLECGFKEIQRNGNMSIMWVAL